MEGWGATDIRREWKRLTGAGGGGGENLAREKMKY